MQKMIVQVLGSEKNLGDEGDEEGLEGGGRSSCGFGGGVDDGALEGEEDEDDEYDALLLPWSGVGESSSGSVISNPMDCMQALIFS